MYSRERVFGGIIGNCVMLGILLVNSGSFAAQVDDAVGQEMRRSQERVTDAEQQRQAESPSKELLQAPETEMVMPDVDADDAQQIRHVLLAGDAAWARRQGFHSWLVEQLGGETWDASSVATALKGVNDKAIGAGFYLARFWLPETGAFEDGTLTVQVDAGRVGLRNIVFTGSVDLLNKLNEYEPERATGRFFSASQIDRRFRGLHEEAIFNYKDFYDRFYTLNAHPDLTADVDLRLRTETQAERDLRYVDMDLRVVESLPLHAVLDLDNYGTDASGEWMSRLTLQYLNLTRADDVLTLSAHSSFDVGALYGGAGSYYRPHHFWQGGAFTLYGGYTEVDAKDVVPRIDVEGDGWFVGLQGSMRILDTSRYLMSASLGVVHRYISSGLVVDGFKTLPRDLTIRPVSLALMFSDKTADAWHGRNYVTLEAVYNRGDFLDTSDDLEVKAQRVAADADYSILRLQAARTQMFGGTRQDDGGYLGRWIAFMRVQGQYADGALIHAEQMGLGGANSIRGYKEREYLGDHAVAGTVEIRTPLIIGLFTRAIQPLMPRWQPPETPIDRLQLVAFADGGYMEIVDALPGEDSNQTLFSAGAGLRLSLTQHAQLKFDWGFPVEETPESSSSGRGHVNLQIQF